MPLIVKFVSYLFSSLFPVSCLLCGAYGNDVCKPCRTAFTWPKYQKRKWITSFLNYRDPSAERILRHIKSMPNQRVADFLGRLFSERILNRPRDPHDWIFIPIPISRTRLRERGFNQSILIARAMSHYFLFPVITNALIKRIHTKKQGTSRSRSERSKNILGSFLVRHPHLIQGKNIILIDDIVTTGSTLVEARYTLIHAGARRVIAWTIAN